MLYAIVIRFVLVSCLIQVLQTAHQEEATGQLDPVSAVRESPLPYTVYRERLNSEEPPEVMYQYFLRLEECGQYFPLLKAKGYVESDGTWYPMEGFDQESLELNWVKTGQILHVRWETVRIGSGANQAQGNLLLILSGEKWREIFRDYRGANTRGGFCDYNRNYLMFQWADARQVLELVQVSESGRTTEMPGVLVTDSWKDANGVMHYCRTERFESIWECELKQDSLLIGAGMRYLVFEPASDSIHHAPHTLRDVAKYFSELSPQKSIFEKQARSLMELNKDVTLDDRCPVRLVVAKDTPPFEVRSEELLRTGESK